MNDYRAWMEEWGVTSISQIEGGWAFALDHDRWAVAFGVTYIDGGPLRIIIPEVNRGDMFAIVEYDLENWHEIVAMRVKYKKLALPATTTWAGCESTL